MLIHITVKITKVTQVESNSRTCALSYGKMYSCAAITRTIYLHRGGWATILNGPHSHVSHKECCNSNSYSQVQRPRHWGGAEGGSPGENKGAHSPKVETAH